MTGVSPNTGAGLGGGGGKGWAVDRKPEGSKTILPIMILGADGLWSKWGGVSI
jgi:hypothetical protein